MEHLALSRLIRQRLGALTRTESTRRRRSQVITTSTATAVARTDRVGVKGCSVNSLRRTAAAGLILLVGLGLTSCAASPAELPDEVPKGNVAAIVFAPNPQHSRFVPGFIRPRHSHLVLVHSDPDKTQVAEFPAVEYGGIDFDDGTLAVVDKNYTYLIDRAIKPIKNTTKGQRPKIVRVLPNTDAALTAWDEGAAPDGYNYPFQVSGKNGGVTGNIGVPVNGSAVCGDKALVAYSGDDLNGKASGSRSVLLQLDPRSGWALPVAKGTHPKGRTFAPVGSKYPCKDGVVYQLLQGTPSSGTFYFQMLNSTNRKSAFNKLELAPGQDAALFSPAKHQGATAMTVWQDRFYWLNPQVAKVFSCDLAGKDARVEFEVAGQTNPDAMVSGVDFQGDTVTVLGGTSTADRRSFFVRQYFIGDGSPMGPRIVMNVPAEIPDDSHVTGLVGTPAP